MSGTNDRSVAENALGEGVADSSLSSADLAPTRPDERKWRARDFAVLWISLSACVPTYMLASSLIASGMDWRQAVGTIFLGNVIVLVPMILNGHAGARYGIPFPVYCRASFGVLGANVPALLRALVACGWFGIQCWIGGEAIYTALTVWVPAWQHSPPEVVGINLPLAVCFLAFWGANVVVIWRGIESIRLLLTIKAPLLILLGLALLGWAYREAGGMGPILEQPSQFGPGGEKAGQFWSFFFPALTAMVGFWATLSLNGGVLVGGLVDGGIGGGVVEGRRRRGRDGAVGDAGAADAARGVRGGAAPEMPALPGASRATALAREGTAPRHSRRIGRARHPAARQGLPEREGRRALEQCERVSG